MTNLGKLGIATSIVAPTGTTIALYEMDRQSRIERASDLQKEKEDLVKEKETWNKGINEGELVLITTNEYGKLKEDRETKQLAEKIIRRIGKDSGWWSKVSEDKQFDLIEALQWNEKCWKDNGNECEDFEPDQWKV